MTPMPSMPFAQDSSAEHLHDLSRFLFREAWLLDQQRFDEWLALFADDATYWVPLEERQADGIETCSIIHDNRELLGLRVRQYREARAHARLPLARTVHQVANVLVLEELAGGEVLVASTLVIVEYRQERQRTWGATVQHRLRRVGDDWQIVLKRIDLVNSESELDGIAFLL